MTSISAASTSSYLSPLDLLKKELQAEVSAGKVSSTDQSALSTALDDIDSALKGQSGTDSSTGSSSSTTKPPGDLQSKIDDLISGEVSSGKLTSDQASELKNVFTNAFASGGPGGSHGPGGPPPPPPSDSSDSSSSTDSTSSTSAADLLQQLLQALQNSLSQSSSYGASGNSNSSSSASSSLLVDFKS